MKKILTFVVLSICINGRAISQDIQIDFTGFGGANGVETINVQNLTQGTELTMNGTDILHLVGIVGIANGREAYSQDVLLYPNPTSGNFSVEFNAKISGTAQMQIFDILGKALHTSHRHINSGLNKIGVMSVPEGIYYISINSGATNYFGKIISHGSMDLNFRLYSEENSSPLMIKSNNPVAKELVQMQYNFGDQLLCKGISGDYETVMLLTPNTDTTIAFNFESYADGFYILGENIPSNSISPHCRMVNGINEVTFQERDGMYELLVPISDMDNGFCLCKIDNGEYTYFTNHSEETVVLNGEWDQIIGSVIRGVVEISDNPVAGFTVPQSGLYKFVIDLQTQTYLIIPVNNIGIIGHATQNGWSSDINLEQVTDINFETIHYKIENLVLNHGDFKFRLSNGWKVNINDDVKVSTNYGGYLSGELPVLEVNMTLNGGNISILPSQRGIYSVNVFWSFENGLSASLTKTGDYPLVTYQNVTLGLIGDCYLLGSGQQAFWDENYPGSTNLPTLSENKTTWLFSNILLNQAGDFIFRQHEYWDGLILHPSAFNSVSGTASGFVGGGQNFTISAAGTYNIRIEYTHSSELFDLIIDTAK